MIHPDPTVRADGLRRLGVMLAAARRLGVGLVTLCTGSRDALDQWRHHPDNATPAAWADLCREMARRWQMAEAAGVDLGIEPEQANVVTSAADAMRLIGEMGSARVRIVLDPANLFERADRAEARAVVAEAIDLLGDRIAMAHGKDRAADGSFTTVGKGVVDFPDFIARLGAAGFARTDRDPWPDRRGGAGRRLVSARPDHPMRVACAAARRRDPSRLRQRCRHAGRVPARPRRRRGAGRGEFPGRPGLSAAHRRMPGARRLDRRLRAPILDSRCSPPTCWRRAMRRTSWSAASRPGPPSRCASPPCTRTG